MRLDLLRERFATEAIREAVIWRERSYEYRWLLEELDRLGVALADAGVRPGSVVSLESDYSPHAVALLLALIERDAIVMPIVDPTAARANDLYEIAQVEVTISFDDRHDPRITHTTRRADHELIGALRARAAAGLILFSSGSTGKNKGIVHDMERLMAKFHSPRTARRTVAFLLFDHIGGLNTLFYALHNTACIVFLSDRRPDTVARAIERSKAQLLPTTPTFINLLLVSEAHKRFDLSSLELMTYGTEVMPESVLARLRAQYPKLKLQQTYGLSEVGVLHAKSKSSESLWMRIGGEGFETRVVDGLLEVRAASAMLGYLNAPSPFTDDGWCKTGDAVEVDGDFVRILGRRSDVINVGGEKVYPAEVEGVLQSMQGVDEVAVWGEPNPLTGRVVCARVKLRTDEDVSAFRARMYEFCRGKLAAFKIPQSVSLVSGEMHTERYKKVRGS